MKNCIKEMRKSLKMTQADLALQIGISRQSVNAIETGKFDPSIEVAIRISKVFGKSVNELFIDEDFLFKMSEKTVWKYKDDSIEKNRKLSAWKNATGLQDVDGLKVSEYLLSVANSHIDGHLDIENVKRQMLAYYENQNDREKEREADLVSTKITELILDDAFEFSYQELSRIHKSLFDNIYDHAGRFRNRNLSKREWVLNDKSVVYADHKSIIPTLEYDFDEERSFDYSDIKDKEAVKHLARFIANIWQVHPFMEGNTRTITVFLIKYLRSFGFEIVNDLFYENSWYFRNALVRANYSDWSNDIYETTIYLEEFLKKLIFDEGKMLRNRDLKI